MPFPTTILAARKKLNPYYYRLNDGLSHGIGIGRLAPLLFEKMYRKVVPMRRLHPLPDAISDGNFGRTKKLNPYYYCLKHGLSHGIGIARLAPFLFEKNVPKSGAYEAIAPTSRRHFRRKFRPHEKTEPLLLPFKAWAFTWYRYCPASNVAHEWDRRTDSPKT